MKDIARQSARFAAAALLLDLIFEAVTMQLPLPITDLNEWKKELTVPLTLVATDSICAFVAGLIGFYWFPKGRHLTMRQLLYTAACFVGATIFATEPLAARGASALLLGLVGIAFLAIQSVGRWLARQHTQRSNFPH
jgi:hypothetical protein